MKKKVTLLLLMMTIIIGLVACSGKDKNDYSEDSNEKIDQHEEDISEDDGTKKNDDSEVEESVQESYEHNDFYLWVSTLKKGELKVPSMLFDEKFSVPITEDMINQIGGFKTSALKRWNDEAYKGRTEFDDLTTILNAPTDAAEWEWGWNKIEVFDVPLDNAFENLYVISPIGDTTEMSIREAFDQGYWYLETSYNADDALGIEDKMIWNEETKEWEQFNAITEKLGTPSYIVSIPCEQNGVDITSYSMEDYRNQLDNALARGTDSSGMVLVNCHYYMVYEYDEFVILVNISENFDATPDSTIYLTELYSVRYYPINGWNTYFKEEVTKDCPIIELD